jgi:hypothetical protein
LRDRNSRAADYDPQSEWVGREHHMSGMTVMLTAMAAMTAKRSRVRRRKVLVSQVTKLGMCQVRSKTESPCLHRAVVEMLGIPFCEECAREQEAYFAIGELTQETQNLRSDPLGKTLGETLDGMRRQRTDGLAAARRFALTKS